MIKKVKYFQTFRVNLTFHQPQKQNLSGIVSDFGCYKGTEKEKKRGESSRTRGQLVWSWLQPFTVWIEMAIKFFKGATFTLLWWIWGPSSAKSIWIFESPRKKTNWLNSIIKENLTWDSALRFVKTEEMWSEDPTKSIKHKGASNYCLDTAGHTKQPINS